ncbi:hypothetical protein DL96DRAFT_1477750, partial [Flagelloscypha sp. PMI_526]
SSQTKDKVTDTTVINLCQSISGTIPIDAFIQASEATISKAMKKDGFWGGRFCKLYLSPLVCTQNRRGVHWYIKKAALKLRDDFDSDVPKTVDELCSLPSIGPKMAFLTLEESSRS